MKEVVSRQYRRLVFCLFSVLLGVGPMTASFGLA
jgi:hypothetical protein